MTSSEIFFASTRACVVAPAGCGKTQLIAKTVCLNANHRSLILTHTNAGVDVLRKRLKILGAVASSYEIDTIAGWSHKLTSSFPKTSGITYKCPEKEQWDLVYKAALGLLSINAIRIVLRVSYDSVFVDEYQDCSPLQHSIMVSLADIIPTRIVGDPLQGIFEFRRSKIVSWEKDVHPNFTMLPPLCKPHRWVNNITLGKWLLQIRRCLEDGIPVDLRTAPKSSVKFIKLPQEQNSKFKTQLKVCQDARCKPGETMLAIHSWENQCHNVARRTGGKFKSPETVECNDLLQAAKGFDDVKDGLTLARLTYDFGRKCLTKLNTEIGKKASKLLEGKKISNNKYQEQMDALNLIIQERSYSSIKRALCSFYQIPGAKVVRFELFKEMIKSINEYERGQYGSLEEAAIITRQRTSKIGRSPGRYVVSRTLLIKGLEFDHVIILNANELTCNNLYVALTRASRSLTILSASHVLNPSK